MSDNESSNNSSSKDKVKPAIFYAQKSKEDKPKRQNDKRDFDKPRSNSRGGYGKNPDKSRAEKGYSGNRQASDSRIETFKPRAKKPMMQEGDSPWKARVNRTEHLPTYDTTVKPEIEHNSKRQRKEETLVYSENSCKAVFAKRPEAIIKAFFLQEKTFEFKALIAHLVEHRLGYDVISDEEMTKIAQTPHHGGICLIVKKRQSQLVAEYLSANGQLKQDCVLAIDDINNPHNLGGIARTTAFFDVNALLLRKPELLDNGAAMRVAEGGCEAINLIKADDFVASIDQFKQQGYQIIALLPCKVSSLKAETFEKVTIKTKIVFVVFQQINTKLAALADDIVYLPGSEAMAALNISVLTGIMLAKWKAFSHRD
ncbi:TrmH RNA methyltransferase [Orbus hercynius]|uniref:TrmH RNA methyltransferase n=1 Tax=Orbus hercynius TaxID=593135 RepID=A0A495RCQ3_9GAMM|nr:tRNA/rRNA methyltransferase [Orbus hercynius]RKS85139.1 TrmH RNA methyltransferase [Orbus hercynius]